MLVDDEDDVEVVENDHGSSVMDEHLEQHDLQDDRLEHDDVEYVHEPALHVASAGDDHHHD